MAATKKLEDGFFICEIKAVVAMTIEHPVMMWTLNDAQTQKTGERRDYVGQDNW